VAKPKVQLPAYAERRRVPTPEVSARSTWCFGFRFWRQVDNFGLSEQDPGWFISLLERLRQLSNEDDDVLDRDHAKRDFYRYHSVNWHQPGIPIRLRDLDWVPTEYRENPEEYPFYQFTISMALGRVAGFHDENGIFQIVLLDPKHNLQPPKKFDYKVDSCTPQANKHELFLGELKEARNSAKPCSADCAAKIALDRLDGRFQPRGVVYVSDELVIVAQKLVEERKITSIESLLEKALLEA
jgi:hypothetical protein